jgi:membrane protease YdiL (CAAX protease family)
MNLPLGEKLNSAKGGFAYSVAVVAYFGVAIIISIIIQFGAIGGDAAIYLNYLASPIGIVLALAFFFTQAKVRFNEVYTFKCSPKYYILAIMLIYGLMFSLSQVNYYLIEFAKLFGYTQKITSSSLPDLNGANIILAVFVIAVLPAIFEEALFRGAILKNAQSTVGTYRAVLLVGFVFSLYHGSVEQTIYQFICGCVFALLAARSGSLLPSVLMHFLNNGVILVLAAANCYDDAGNLLISDGGNIAIMVTSAICLIAAVVYLILDRKNTVKCQKGAVKSFFLWGSVGIALMAIIWIAGLFV